jgi:deoxyadenosine/deoxycytidine kinase
MQTVSIIGNIGAGKSTLIDKLKEHKVFKQKAFLLPEDVKSFKSLLTLFYSDKAKHAKSLQDAIYTSNSTRLREAKTATESLPECSVIITERSSYDAYHTFVCLLHEAGHLTELYLQKWEKKMQTPDCIVYLDTPVDVCLQRMSIRGREGEDLVPKSYMNALHDKHEKLAKTYKALPGSSFVILDHRLDLDDMAVYLEKALFDQSSNQSTVKMLLK